MKNMYCISHSIWHGSCNAEDISVPSVRSVLMKKLLGLVAGIASLAVLAMNCLPATAQAEPTIKLGYAKCAHCTPLALLPQYAKGVKVEASGFNTGTDVLTPLLSTAIEVGRGAYPHSA